MLFQRAYCLALALTMAVPAMAQPFNTLTAAEKQDGWTLLFDGKSLSQWRGAYMADLPRKGWVIQNGELRGEFTAGMEAGDGGDIVSRKTYSNFEMVFDWKLGAGGNSGVKYFVEERQPKPVGSQPGYLPQMLAVPGVQVVTVCDPDRWRMAEAQKFVNDFYAKRDGKTGYAGCTQTIDFRDVIHAKDVDALMISVPDHWHTTMGTMAAKAKKNFSLEKPLSLSVQQGRALADAVKSMAWWPGRTANSAACVSRTTLWS